LWQTKKNAYGKLMTVNKLHGQAPISISKDELSNRAGKACWNTCNFHAWKDFREAAFGLFSFAQALRFKAAKPGAFHDLRLHTQTPLVQFETGFNTINKRYHAGAH
jgi:hypothetical protein